MSKFSFVFIVSGHSKRALSTRCFLLSPRRPFGGISVQSNGKYLTEEKKNMISKDGSSKDFPPPFLEPIHILGAGSIGLLIGAHLKVAFPGLPVTMLLRPQDPRRKIVVNLTSDEDAKKGHTKQRVVHLAARSVDSIRPSAEYLRHVFVTTKAYSARPALDSLRDCLRINQDSQDERKRTSVTFLGNGALAVQRELLDLGYPVEIGMLTHGAYRCGHPHSRSGSRIDNDMETVVHAGKGRMYLSHNSSLADLLDKAMLQCHHVPTSELDDLLWLKLAANCVINPLAASHGMRNGEITQLKSFPEIKDSILSELDRVYSAVVTAGRSSSKLSRTNFEEFVQEVMEETSSNQSSMLQDIQAGRNTEIEYLNGYICQLASEHSIDCRTNAKLVQLIHELESRGATPLPVSR